PNVGRSKQSPRHTRFPSLFLKTLGTKMGTISKSCRIEVLGEGCKRLKAKAPQVGLEPTTLRLTVTKVSATYDRYGLLQTTTGEAFSPLVHTRHSLRITMFGGGFLGTLGTKMGTASAFDASPSCWSRSTQSFILGVSRIIVAFVAVDRMSELHRDQKL